MTQSSFAIQFRFAKYRAKGNELIKRHYVYQANINTLSRSFNLFEVSGIKRVTKTRTIRLPGAYYLTSYPLCYAGSETWKDALTTNADEFLQAIGDAIESYLTISNENFYSSN